MNIYSSKNRIFRAVKVCVALSGLFWVFRLATSPFLEIERKDVTNIGETKVVVHEWRQDAAKWFPENSWVVSAENHFRDNGRYLFCNNFDLNQADSQINAKPIAMLWQTEDNDIPIRIVADSAALKSSEKLFSGDTGVGTIAAAKLSGNVVIRGPDNLWIKGHSFQFDKESMKLWSSSRIEFRWNTHKGKASSGIEIQLNAGGPEDKIDVTSIRKIQLLGTVIVDYSDPPERRGEEGIELKIRAPFGFVYEVMFKTATFLGQKGLPHSQPLSPPDSVMVYRKTPSGAFDRLICPELEVKFGDNIDIETGKLLDDKPKPMLIQAWGRAVKLESPENELQLIANRIRYFLDKRRLEIETASMSGRDDMLRIKQKDSYLELPPTVSGDPAQISVLHSGDNTIQRVEFIVPPSQQKTGSRPGRITSKVPPRKSKGATNSKMMSLAAEWGESLLIQLAPDGASHIVKLDGGARVSADNMGFGLNAKTIAMKILGTPESEKVTADPNNTDQGSAIKTVSVSSPVKPDTGPKLDLSNLTPDILTAVGDVLLESTQGTGRLRDRLTVEFEQVETPAVDVKSPNKTKKASSNPASSLNRKPKPGDAVSFDADSLKARIHIDPNQEMSFHDVWLTGDVEIERQSLKATEAFTAFGNQLYAMNGLMDQREIQLFGDPARVVSQTGELEGTRIDLKEVGSVESAGSGSIRFISDKGLDGKKLSTPMPIDIYWSNKMEYRKNSAHFAGNIRVSMVDENSQAMEVTCAGLTVHFSEDSGKDSKGDTTGFSAFSTGDAKSKKKAKVESIEFNSKVVVTIDQVTEGISSGRHTATFADLVVNLQSGDFDAIGPGFIESVSPDKEGNLQGAPPATARANSPAQTTQTAFVYMQVEFIGELTGNLHRKEAELTQNVVAIVTPARNVDEEFDLQIVSTDDLPERAGILRAEMLSISSVEQPGLKADSDSLSFSMIARNNARLESRSITARADEIVYDHSKQQFIMKADGEGRVTVNHRSGPRGKFNRFNGKRCEYYRRTNELKGDRINGFEVTE